jgi:hypothetical protein
MKQQTNSIHHLNHLYSVLQENNDLHIKKNTSPNIDRPPEVLYLPSVIRMLSQPTSLTLIEISPHTIDTSNSYSSSGVIPQVVYGPLLSNVNALPCCWHTKRIGNSKLAVKQGMHT